MNIELLRAMAKAKYGTMAKFAEAIGLSTSEVCLIMKGKRGVSIDTVRRIKKELKLDNDTTILIFFGSEGA